MQIQDNGYDQYAISIADFVQSVPWSRSKTYQLIKSGHLKTHKVGRCTVLLPADIEDFFQRLQAKGGVDSAAKLP